MKISELKVGTHVWIMSWHGNKVAVGEVLRTTATQVVVQTDYSFQGGTSSSVARFRRNNGPHGYGAGKEMAQRMCPDSLGRVATDSEWETHKQKCSDGVRARKAQARQEDSREATRKRLNALLPDGVYVEVNRDQDEFSINISKLVTEYDVTEIGKLLRQYLPAKKVA